MRDATASSNHRSSRFDDVRTTKGKRTITTTPIYVIVQLTPTGAWRDLPRDERTRWVEDRFAQLGETFADDGSRPLWSQITEMHTTRGVERSVVLLWRIEDDISSPGWARSCSATM